MYEIDFELLVRDCDSFENKLEPCSGGDKLPINITDICNQEIDKKSAKYTISTLPGSK